MFRTLVFAVAIAAIWAQDLNELKSTDPKLNVTGGNGEYMKFVKGDLERDPKNYRLYLKDQQHYLSTWHDIPLFFDEQNKVVNMVVEIKRGEGLDTQMDVSQPMSPLIAKMDKNGNMDQVHIDYIHNIGYLPQTFLSSEVKDTLSGLMGTNRPLEVVEISDRDQQIGDVVPVKILGVLGVMNDMNEIDYKLIALDINSAFAPQIKTLNDVEKIFPDLLMATRGFFRYFRYPDKLNNIAFDGQYKDDSTAWQLINEKHQQWMNLIKMQTPPEGLNIESHQEGAAHPANDMEWEQIVKS